MQFVPVLDLLDPVRELVLSLGRDWASGDQRRQRRRAPKRVALLQRFYCLLFLLGVQVAEDYL